MKARSRNGAGLLFVHDDNNLQEATCSTWSVNGQFARRQAEHSLLFGLSIAEIFFMSYVHPVWHAGYTRSSEQVNNVPIEYELAIKIEDKETFGHVR